MDWHGFFFKAPTKGKTFARWYGLTALIAPVVMAIYLILMKS